MIITTTDIHIENHSLVTKHEVYMFFFYFFICTKKKVYPVKFALVQRAGFEADGLT